MRILELNNRIPGDYTAEDSADERAGKKIINVRTALFTQNGTSVMKLER